MNFTLEDLSIAFSISFTPSIVDILFTILSVKDLRKNNRLIEVQIKNNNLKCITDDKFDCIHVGFTLALPEVRKALSK